MLDIISLREMHLKPTLTCSLDLLEDVKKMDRPRVQ